MFLYFKNKGISGYYNLYNIIKKRSRTLRFFKINTQAKPVLLPEFLPAESAQRRL